MATFVYASATCMRDTFNIIYGAGPSRGGSQNRCERPDGGGDQCSEGHHWAASPLWSPSAAQWQWLIASIVQQERLAKPMLLKAQNCILHRLQARHQQGALWPCGPGPRCCSRLGKPPPETVHRRKLCRTEVAAAGPHILGAAQLKLMHPSQPRPSTTGVGSTRPGRSHCSNRCKRKTKPVASNDQ